MRVARSVAELGRRERSVAIGAFDGVHRGHRSVIETAVAAGGTTTVVTFDPHPRIALGYGVDLLATLERRLELIAELGVEETLVVEFTLDVARLDPQAFARGVLDAIGARVVVVGESFRFGQGRRGDLETLRALGFDVRAVPAVEVVSSTEIRRLLREGHMREAAALLGRPYELDGTVVAGDARGGTLGFPTANLSVPPGLLVPGFGIYVGDALGHRAAVSIGVNPHYGGDERRVEAFLLDFEGDLYGRELRLELWERLREERAFGSERELVDQIARDVEQAQAATRPG